MSTVIRAGMPSDAEAMGRLHVRAWQAAYRGVMPDEYLDGLLASERIGMWEGRLARTDLPPLLVAVVDGNVVGFAVFGGENTAKNTAEGDARRGELYAMNLDPDQWGRGIGRALLREATASLAQLGYVEAVLWVVPENTRARSLYESEGWIADGGIATEEVLGATVTDIRYHTRLRP